MASPAGPNAPVLDMEFQDQGIVVAGKFSQVGNVQSSGIARWTGTAWESIGDGLNGWVQKVVIDGENIYASGRGRYPYFTLSESDPSGLVAKWEGEQWTDWTANLVGDVVDIAARGEDVYVTGTFLIDGPAKEWALAKWEDEHWTFIDGYEGLAYPEELLFVHSDLFVSDRVRIARLSQGVWTVFEREDLTDEPRGIIKNMVAHDSLFVYGINNDTYWQFHQWEENGWREFAASTSTGQGPVGVLRDFDVSGDDVFAIGNFGWGTNIDGELTRGILRWDGSEWGGLGRGTSFFDRLNEAFYPSGVNTVLTVGSDVYIGGEFWRAGGVSSKYFGRWSGAGGVSNQELLPEYTTENYGIFPNPAKQQIYLRATLPVGGFVQVKIFNALGQQVLMPVNEALRRGPQDISIDVSLLSAGVYFVRIQKDERVTVIPIAIID